MFVIIVVFLRLDFDIEASQVENFGNFDLRVSRLIDARGAIQDADFVFQLLKVFGIDQIDFVEQHQVGKGNLLARLGRVIDLLPNVLRIDDGHYPIELECTANPLIDKERLYGRGRMGEAGCLDHQRVELRSVLEQLKQAAEKIAANGTADAAIAHFHDFLIGGNQQ